MALFSVSRSTSGALSKRVIAACIFDWAIVVFFGLICLAFYKREPNYHPFTLVDLTISYPYKEELVTTTDLAIAAILLPGVLIFLVCLFLIPGPAYWKTTSKWDLLILKLWEWHIGWLGLGLSLTTSLLFVSGMKNAFGKPRPNMLSLCQPDLTRLASATIGGFGQPITDRWVLVNQSICTQTDTSKLYDGFRSFPSGHSATSWAGLLYFTLWICSKFGLSFPSFPNTYRGSSSPQSGAHVNGSTTKPSMILSHRNESAAPPSWTLVLLALPIGGAIFICASRWFDYRHHGFDIIAGSLIGIMTSYIAWRLHQVPLSQTYNAGWAWGPRSPSRAFGIGVGTLGYSKYDVHDNDTRFKDIELGNTNGVRYDQRQGHQPGQTSVSTVNDRLLYGDQQTSRQVMSTASSS